MKRFNFLKNRPQGNESGFTLIEAMIALLVFSVGILAVATLQSTSIDANMLAQQTTVGAAAAASVIEDLNPMDYIKAAELSNGDHNLPNIDQYSISYNVTRNAIINNTMLVLVTINWTVRGNPKNVNLVLIKPDII